MKPRDRLLLALALIAVICLGLASRKYAAALPDFLSENAGDALWTVAVYLTLAVISPQTPPWKLGLAAFGISLLDELSQLFHPHWLDSLRHTLPGRLLLGSTFVPADLVRYAVGAVLATVCDVVVISAGSSQQTPR